MLHVSRCALTRRTLCTNPTSSSSFLSKVIGKNVRRLDDVIMWPQMTFQWEMMQQRVGDIKHRVSGYDSGWIGQIWCALKVLIFYHWLIGNGEVMKLTWPEVTDIKNPRYINRRYLSPYFTLRVSKSLDLWSVFFSLSTKTLMGEGRITAPRPCAG